VINGSRSFQRSLQPHSKRLWEEDKAATGSRTFLNRAAAELEQKKFAWKTNDSFQSGMNQFLVRYVDNTRPLAGQDKIVSRITFGFSTQAEGGSVSV
jgi:hypothetical protein